MLKKINKNEWFVKIGLVIVSLFFIMPSLVYLAKNKTTMNFIGDLEFCFLLVNDKLRVVQTLVYACILILFLMFYFYILKKRNELFKNEKSVFKYVLIISSIFVICVPFMSSDVFYYLGIGRLGGYYHQNPYYIDIKSYIDTNQIDLTFDTLMKKGYDNYWSNTTVVYGPIWTIICSLVSLLSFGNLDVGLLIFKIFNLVIHLLNCYLLYKLSKNKIFPLIYGLNPFILIEGIANVHNDIFVVFFMLLSIFYLIKKKNLILSILALALATDIKYFSILLLPLLVLYKYKDEDIKHRILRCLQYGMIFIIFAGVPYLFYIKDKNVFLGLIVQRERYCKGLYLTISLLVENSDKLISSLKNMALIGFSCCYIINCITLLFTKKIKFYKEIRSIYCFVLVFLFLLLTNFQPWYFMWLSVFIIWQKSKSIKLINQIQILTLIANIVFLINSECYIYGPYFFGILVLGIIISVIFNNRKRLVKGVKK